jgi:predicted nucleotidyltransferase
MNSVIRDTIDGDAMLEPDEIEGIVDFLDDRLGVDAVWVFGSVATGDVRQTSDVDLAGLFRRTPSAMELIETREELAHRVGRDVDLVDLDHASPILAMQVLRHGRLLVDRDPRRRQRFVAGVPGRYEDVKIVRRDAERALLARVRDGRS